MTKGLIKYWEFFFFRMLQLSGVWLLSKSWLNVVRVDRDFNSSNPVHAACEVTRLKAISPLVLVLFHVKEG
jgi:hypothetical protein